MLKFEIDSLEGLDESLQGFYEQHGEKYRLKVEGIDPADELKEALRKEREERRAAKERAEELERKAQIAAEEAARKNGDIEALENSWREKLDKTSGELMAKLTKANNFISESTAGRDAVKLAAAIAIDADAAANIEDYVRGRLRTEFRDDVPTTVVLGADGKPSAMTLEELQVEVSLMPRFKHIVAGSKATGGGAAGSKGGGAAKTWDQLSGMERVELRRTNPAEHARLKAAAGQ
ncbi:hypothetical protein [Stutzerimonas nitrititolerans]|uniref:hypothetical protein n=1 Tax=Stutzerimonas nitrititolerans TaxID=2482751 RepID=UPI00289A4D34|nr:hypothetical protein [Stutzerimonas nitrititolerans]